MQTRPYRAASTRSIDGVVTEEFNVPTGAEYISWSSSPSAGEVGLNLRRPRGDVDTARRDVGRPKKAMDGADF